MKVEIFAKGVEGEEDAGHACGAVQGGAQIFGEAFLGQRAEPLEQVAMALEKRAEYFGDGQGVMAVGHWHNHVVEDEAGSGFDVFLVAGGTEPAAFAGEGQRVLMGAVVAADAGEAAFEVAAFEDLWTT
jgi:hypothetical protein